MNKAANAISMPLDEEYLAKFNRIAFEDVPADMLACYFRLDKGRITLLGSDPLFVVNSRNAVVRALDNGYEPELIFIRNHEYNRDLADRIGLFHPDAQICFLDDEKRDALRDDPDGKAYSFISFKCAGLFRKKPLKSVPDILHTSKRVVIFRGFDPASEDFLDIGPQVRSAVAFFADAVLFGSGVDPYDHGLIRATAGNLFYVPFAVYEREASPPCSYLPEIRRALSLLTRRTATAPGLRSSSITAYRPGRRLIRSSRATKKSTYREKPVPGSHRATPP